MVKTIVVGATVPRARYLAEEMGIKGAYLTSPRSILGGAGRGIDSVGLVLVDDTALPLSDEVKANLRPTVSKGGGQMYSVSRIF